MTAEAAHLLVMASAGTGKTFQLTGRYMRHALEQLQAEERGGRGDLAGILATTFTRKAAGEILDKVLERLSAAADEPSKLQELQEHVDPGMTREGAVRLLAGILKKLDRLNVVTIDALFLRIASLFALELGIPPGWGIAEEETDEELREEALDAVLEEGDRQGLLKLLEMLSRGKAKRSVREMVLTAVGDVYEAFLAAEGRLEPWEVFGPAGEPLKEAELREAIDALAGVRMPATLLGGRNRNWLKANAAAIECAQAGDWEGLLARGIAARLLKAGNEPALYSGVEIDDATAELYRPLMEHAGAVMLGKLRAQNQALFHFAAQFHQAYVRLKGERGLYRFDDIPRLLLDAALQDQLEHVYFRLDAAIRHVLLDEFQDTSMTQFRLLKPLLDELLSSRDGRSVFCVGDVKQSLYGWRGAEPALMPALPERWPALDVQPLDTSYRSSPVIIETVNAVFEDLPANPALAEHEHVADRWRRAFHRHSTARSFAGGARLVVAEVDGEGEPLAMRCAARRAREIVDAAPGASIGILVRTNKHIPVLMYELKRLGVEASEEGGSCLADAMPVAVALSLLRLADFPGDSAAAFHVATSPLGARVGLVLPVEAQRVREVAGEVRRRLMSEGYAGTLRWIQRAAAAEMDERGFARFEQLIDLAQEFDGRAGMRPSEFERLARERRVEDATGAGVRVMTIHRAKGLQFDAVILPDLDSRWEITQNRFLLDRADPFGDVVAATSYPSAVLRQLDRGLAELYERSLERCISEELSCLYVAMTRAVHSLDMILLPSTRIDFQRSAAGVLRAALAPDSSLQPGSVLWESPDSSDWAGDVDRLGGGPAAEEVGLVVKPGRGSFVPRRQRSSPSTLQGGVVRVDSVFSVRGARARDEGLLLHAWFELIEWLEDGEPGEEQLLGAARKAGWRDESARELLPAFAGALRGDAGRVLMRSQYEQRPEAERVEVRREWPFEVCLPGGGGKEPIELSGRFDRLVLGWRGAEVIWAEIVDFKSDQMAEGDETKIAAAVDHYRPQMQAYVAAVREMFSLEEVAVSGMLLFVKSGAAVDCGG